MTEEDLARLRAEKARIMEEIRAYPPPIPGCNALFNWLLQRRAEIERALAYGVQTPPGT